MKQHAIIAAAILLFCLPVTGQQIDPERSVVNFTAYHGNGNPEAGTIAGMQGLVLFDPERPGEARFEVCVDPATVRTDSRMRDSHLRSRSFFHTKQYPEICFASDRIETNGAGYVVYGRLTMKGITRRVEIPFTYEQGLFLGKFSIDRSDYDVGFRGTGMVADRVDLEIRCYLP